MTAQLAKLAGRADGRDHGKDQRRKRKGDHDDREEVDALEHVSEIDVAQRLRGAEEQNQRGANGCCHVVLRVREDDGF